ncbi:hypothetical protein B0H63DRAFT_523844 [Podospora didyma]|uniref:Uncharacterized protein n=1 Tax=Podospora didyma TaxID=330526 RepID=A0AAE0TVI3_9PEZI|nr:hypothetical protein B0H63DRAFT_523844 [Podospora didyma]
MNETVSAILGLTGGEACEVLLCLAAFPDSRRSIDDALASIGARNTAPKLLRPETPPLSDAGEAETPPSPPPPVPPIRTTSRHPKPGTATQTADPPPYSGPVLAIPSRRLFTLFSRTNNNFQSLLRPSDLQRAQTTSLPTTSTAAAVARTPSDRPLSLPCQGGLDLLGQLDLAAARAGTPWTSTPQHEQQQAIQQSLLGQHHTIEERPKIATNTNSDLVRICKRCHRLFRPGEQNYCFFHTGMSTLSLISSLYFNC